MVLIIKNKILVAVCQSASSKMISDPEEIVKYCKNKWF